MKIDIKNRVNFTRKKKCDVCKKVKTVSYECEECYMNGFDKMGNKFWQWGKEELAKEIIKTIEKRKDRQHIGTLTRIFSYCKKQIRNVDEVKQNDNN